MEETETGLVFVIDGGEYPGPDLDSLNMGERRVLYDLAGIVQEDFAPEEGEAQDDHDARVRRMMRHPGFMESLMHIAYQRGNPELKRDKVQAVIDQTNYVEAIRKWAEEEQAEGDALPPARTTEPDRSSLNGSVGSSESSGPASENGSDAPDAHQSPTGTTRSRTLPMSVQETSPI